MSVQSQIRLSNRKFASQRPDRCDTTATSFRMSLGNKVASYKIQHLLSTILASTIMQGTITTFGYVNTVILLIFSASDKGMIQEGRQFTYCSFLLSMRVRTWPELNRIILILLNTVIAIDPRVGSRVDHASQVYSIMLIFNATKKPQVNF
jgi:hypothetical protein